MADSAPPSSSSSGDTVVDLDKILKDPMSWLEQTALEKLEDPPADLVVTAPETNDVLSGRGGETNHHTGNVQYRNLVKAFQPMYTRMQKLEKKHISRCIVLTIRKMGGRFLAKQSVGVWKDVGNDKACGKTSQTLREGQNVRSSISSSASLEGGGEAKTPTTKKTPTKVKRESSGSAPAKKRASISTKKSKSGSSITPGAKDVASAAAAAAKFVPNNDGDNGPMSAALQKVIADPLAWVEQTEEAIANQSEVDTTTVIQDVQPYDVLCGRGGEVNKHQGNVQFRNLVKAFQNTYMNCRKLDKPKISQCIVYTIRNTLGGRFLQKIDGSEDAYKDVGNKKAQDKTSQALREGQTKLNWGNSDVTGGTGTVTPKKRKSIASSDETGDQSNDQRRKRKSVTTATTPNGDKKKKSGAPSTVTNGTSPSTPPPPPPESNMDWMMNYGRLVQYHKQHGNCNVPLTGNYEDEGFGKWVQIQKDRYKLLSKLDLETYGEV